MRALAPAGYLLVRLPFAVRPIFEDWLTRSYPDKAERVLGLIRSTRDGRMNDYAWGRRMSGQGQYAEQIGRTFEVFKKKLGFDDRLPALDETKFVPPARQRSTAAVLIRRAGTIDTRRCRR